MLASLLCGTLSLGCRDEFPEQVLFVDNRLDESVIVMLSAAYIKVGGVRIDPREAGYELRPGDSGWIGVAYPQTDDHGPVTILDRECRLIAVVAGGAGVFELVIDESPELVPTDREYVISIFPLAKNCPQPGAPGVP